MPVLGAPTRKSKQDCHYQNNSYYGGGKPVSVKQLAYSVTYSFYSCGEQSLKDLDTTSVEEQLSSKAMHPAIRTQLHLPVHTASDLSMSVSKFTFTVALRPRRPHALLETWSPGRSPRLSHSSRALKATSSVVLYVHGDHTNY